jgi:microcystin-dependent protein
MAYQIRFTDQVNKGNIVVEDNTINQETSLSIPGKNTTAYGTAIAENFLHILENFANGNEPSSPVEGQLWYDTSAGVNQLKVYDGTSWGSAGGLKKGLTQPDVTNSVTGDLWVDTDNQQLYLFSGSGWVLVGPDFADGLNTGASPRQLVGTDDQTYVVLFIEVEAAPIVIVSADRFIPKTTIRGFSEVKPGINITSIDVKGDGVARFNGPAEKAEALVVGEVTVPASNFLRGDQISITNFPLKVKNNGGIALGAGSQFNLGVEGEAGVIRQSTSGANIDLRVNDNGTTKTVIRVDSSTNVGINNSAPDEALDVTGNIQVSNLLKVESVANSGNISEGSIVAKGGVGIAKDTNIGGTLKVLGGTVTRNLEPDLNNARNLGSELVRWQNVYATTFIGDVIANNISGTLAGKSQSSDKLASTTTFELTGDIQAPSFVFDGQVGGGTKTFNTSVSNAFISGKSSVINTQGDDEILINRVTGTTGLFKISQRDLLSAVPTTPVGAIMPYGGANAPTGWLLCTGGEILKVLYPDLFNIIGFTFKDAPLVSDGGVEFFALPDLRGRFALGLDNMGNVAAGRVSGLGASELGNSGGTEEKTISTDNLPEHEHDMRAPNGDQFYAISDVPNSPSSDADAIVYDAPTGSGQGQAFGTSGGILAPSTGDPLDVMNPYLSLNYIIYTGVS